jgi:hypothetical protein
VSTQSINRRTFLKSSSLSAGALALGAVVAEAAPVLAPAAAEAEAPAGQVYANSLNFRTRKNILPLPKFSAQKVAEGVPDSQLTRETTGLLREYSTPLLIAHSHRAFFWANEFGRQTGQPYDKELLFICAAFHDLGLLKPFRTEDDRFEVDSANAVRQFLDHHGVPHTRIQTAWDAISLHTTPGIAAYKPIEVELLYNGVALDVLGVGYEGLDPKLRDRVVAAFPRTDFHRQIAQAFYDGFGYKPKTTEFTCNEDICAHFTRNYKRSNFYEQTQNSAFPNS